MQVVVVWQLTLDQRVRKAGGSCALVRIVQEATCLDGDFGNAAN